jgi:UDP-N-acetylglucosamine 2-epimerase (non-hydrolysing)
MFGTRPEAIKLAPLVKRMRELNEFHITLCSTGQHRDMLEPVLGMFNLTADISLDVMEEGQTLSRLTAEVLLRLQQAFDTADPFELVLLQGDTTSAFASALAAYYRQIKVAHVEAGLRSHDIYNPFPEEVNRAAISRVACLHFAPTESARTNLLKEGIEGSRIHVTGNTIVDAIGMVQSRWVEGGDSRTKDLNPLLDAATDGGRNRIILVTCHRRESFGPDLDHICRALVRIVKDSPRVSIVYPVHMNPNVREPVYRLLRGIPGIYLTEPLDYEHFLYMLSRSYFVLTDSGGVQEEAPSFGKPVLVMRRKTERFEGIESGIARLVGTSETAIYDAATLLLKDDKEYGSMACSENPYGDGQASRRITEILSKYNRQCGWTTI